MGERMDPDARLERFGLEVEILDRFCVAGSGSRKEKEDLSAC